MPIGEFDDTQNLPQNARRRMLAGFQRAGRSAIAPLDEQADVQVPVDVPNPMQAVVPANTPQQSSQFPSGPGDYRYSPARAARGQDQLPTVITPLDVGQGAYPPASRQFTPLESGLGAGGLGAVGSTESIGGTPQYTPIMGALPGGVPPPPATRGLQPGPISVVNTPSVDVATVRPNVPGSMPFPVAAPSSPASPAAGGPAVPGTTLTSSQLGGLSQEQRMGFSALPDVLAPAGTPMGATYLNPSGGYTSTQRNWQNTPLAAGLPTFEDVLRGQANGLGYTGPVERARAMELFNNILNSTSGARTQAGSLDVARQGEQRQQDELRGFTGPGGTFIPGQGQNRSALANEQVLTSQHLRDRQTSMETQINRQIELMTQVNGRPPNADEIAEVRRNAEQAFPSRAPTPGPLSATPPAVVSGAGVVEPPVGTRPGTTTSTTGAGRLNSTEGPPTGNNGTREDFDRINRQLADFSKTNPSAPVADQITYFMQQAGVSAHNVNSVMAAAGTRFGPQALDAWYRQGQWRGSNNPGAMMQQRVRQAVNRLSPGTVGTEPTSTGFWRSLGLVR